MYADVGIIGGTGIGERLLARGGVPLHIPTEEGTVRTRLIEHEGLRIAVASRHSAGHKVPPHLVNYRGMAYAMRQLGVRACFSTAAVGSLRPEWGPGTFVLCSDFLDFTYRQNTLFDRQVVHRDFTAPFGPRARAAVLDAATESGDRIEPKGIYLGLNGPRYETPYEIELYQRLGADLVGMTASSEAILMREIGVDYSCLAIVTNHAAGISPNELSHEEVVEEMKRSGEKAVNLLLSAAGKLVQAS